MSRRFSPASRSLFVRRTSASLATRTSVPSGDWQRWIALVASTGAAIPAESVSNRLTSYPAALLTQPFAESEASFTVAPGGPTLPPLIIADAQPIAGTSLPTANVPSSAAPAASAVGAVPGGVGADIPSVFRATDLSPAIVLLALATAVALGAGHALTPGHGKTLMAAYLVGTRGTPAHAAGLSCRVRAAAVRP